MREIKIKTAKYISGYKLQVEFGDGKKQVVDFGPFLKNSLHPEITKYLDKNLFKSFSLESGELMWNDYELIFPVHDLYTNSLVKGRKSNSQEAS